jgi:hypothetical protein
VVVLIQEPRARLGGTWCAKGYAQVLPDHKGLREKTSAFYLAADSVYANDIKQVQIHNSVTCVEDQQTSTLNNCPTVRYGV